MSRWFYIGLAYSLAGGVLVGYLSYLVVALRRNRRQLETLWKQPSTARDPLEEAV